MATLAQMTLRVARLLMEVTEGTATAGAQTSLTDTLNLIQSDQYFERGTLWLLSGSHAGKVATVQAFSSSIITIPDLGAPAIAAGDRYAVARGVYPYMILVNAIRSALGETFIVKLHAPETPITGDGQSLAIALPDGVSRVAHVIRRDVDDSSNQQLSTHWDERDGYLVFDAAPSETQILDIYYRTDHPELVSASDAISTQINEEWLRWKAAEYVLYWGVTAYGEAKEYRIEEHMNRTLAKLKGLYSRKPVIRVRTLG